jgi:ferredoxin
MIIAEQKTIPEIWEMVKAKEKLLVLGCGGCVTVCLAGGEKEGGILSVALRLKAAKENAKLSITEATIERQCEKEWVNALKDKIESHDAVLSLACGVGVQLIAQHFPSKLVFPALNTKFMGYPEKQGYWLENCAACGNCVLGMTGAVCPIARCSKSLLNGPCGGSQNGKCEINPDTPCGWQLIYDRLKALNLLHMLEPIMPPKDWSTARDGGPRRLVREELMPPEDKKE